MCLRNGLRNMYVFTFFRSRPSASVMLPSYLKRKNVDERSGFTPKRTKTVQCWDRDIICLPSMSTNNSVHITYPRGRYCAKLGESGLIGKLGESSVDDGGPKRKFFQLLTKEAFTISGLFVGWPNNVILVHNVEALAANTYYIIGKMISYCLVYGGQPPVCFSQAIAEYIIYNEIRCQPSLDDIPDHVIKQKLVQVYLVVYYLVCCNSILKCTAEESIILNWTDYLTECKGELVSPSDVLYFISGSYILPGFAQLCYFHFLLVLLGHISWNSYRSPQVSSALLSDLSLLLTRQPTFMASNQPPTKTTVSINISAISDALVVPITNSMCGSVHLSTTSTSSSRLIKVSSHAVEGRQSRGSM